MIKKIHCIPESFIYMAKRENLFFNNSNVIYFGWFLDSYLIGFVGIMFYKNKAVLKNDFVLKSYRRQGIYRKLNEYRINEIKRAGIKTVEANCTESSLPLHLKNGAKIVKQYKTCTKIRYENL